MARTKRSLKRVLVVQVVSLLVALVLASFLFSSRASLEDQALAQGPSSNQPTTDGGASSDAGAAPSAEALADGGDPAEPIDLAIAPDGGVPTHPSGTIYRSPFAKPNAERAVRIKIGMLLNSVDDYDVKSGTFAADFFLSLTSEAPMPKLDLQFPNGKVENRQVLADRPTFKLYRLVGEFKSPADLRKYPFDSQELKILIEDDIRGVDQVRFVADAEHTKIARGFRTVGWQVSYVQARSLSHSYPDRFEGDDLYYGRYVFALGLERFAASAVFKVYVPAFVIVLISLLGIWVPPNEMEVRSNAGAPMLAGAVLFHYALMQELPATSYLTRADKLMLGVYASLLLGMLSTWAMFLVDEEKMTLVFRLSRWIVPVGIVIVMALAVRI